ncbi:MAG TPA: STY0301 family protein [Limnobacter sp.]|nr:STY0301 family protein [Limnobacter sp.]
MKKLIFLAVFMAAFLSNAQASVQCPASVSDPGIPGAPPGWQIHSESKTAPLIGLGVYHGHPRQLVALVPDDVGRVKGALQQRWAFAGDSDAHWLECRYQGMRSTLIRQLPAGLAQCTVTQQDLGGGLYKVSTFECSKAQAPQPVKTSQRCGWFENPTPGNAWLVDSQGEWVVGMQGGHQADGDWPQFEEAQWVAVNRSYGYGCACADVAVDPNSRHVLTIKNAKAQALQQCRKNPAIRIKEPKVTP